MLYGTKHEGGTIVFVDEVLIMDSGKEKGERWGIMPLTEAVEKKVVKEDAVSRDGRAITLVDLRNYLNLQEKK